MSNTPNNPSKIKQSAAYITNASHISQFNREAQRSVILTTEKKSPTRVFDTGAKTLQIEEIDLNSEEQ